MKVFTVVVVVVAGALGWLLIRSQTTVNGLRRDVKGLRGELGVTSNQLVAVQAEMEVTKKQMQSEIDGLHQTVAAAREEKRLMEDKLAAATADLTKRQASEQVLQDANEKLQTAFAAATNELAESKTALAELQGEYADALKHLVAIRADYVKLNQDCALLAAKWIDLAELTAQISIVKRALRDERIAQRQRENRAAVALGNGGFLMRGGTWVAPRTPGNFPLNEGIYRN